MKELEQFRKVTQFGVTYQINDRLFLEKEQEIWIPPEGDRFTTWEAKDESWLRPLGLGKVIKTGSKEYWEFIQPKMDNYIKNFESKMLMDMVTPYEEENMFRVHMDNYYPMISTSNAIIRTTV